MRALQLVWILCSLTAATWPTQAVADLRRQLDRLYYEQELLVSNHKIDLSNLKRQEQEFGALRVFDRIPLREDLPGLKQSLTESARHSGVQLIRFKPLARSRKQPKAPPSRMYSDEHPSFKLREEQLAESIPFEVVAQGSRDSIERWTRSWPEDQLRLARATGKPQSAGPGRWRVRAQAYRFRELKFPTLEPRDPLEWLPVSARDNPSHFAEAEPVLWRLVLRIQALQPTARPLYRTRESLLLNQARMSFFLARATHAP